VDGIKVFAKIQRVSATHYGLILQGIWDAQEVDGISGYFQRQLLQDKLSTSLSVNIQVSWVIMIPIKKIRQVHLDLLTGLYQISIDAQGQVLINRIYKGDVRFLIGLNYWLFKNFN
jgi:hypothetical protein